MGAESRVVSNISKGVGHPCLYWEHLRDGKRCTYKVMFRQFG